MTYSAADREMFPVNGVGGLSGDSCRARRVRRHNRNAAMAQWPKIRMVKAGGTMITARRPEVSSPDAHANVPEQFGSGLNNRAIRSAPTGTITVNAQTTCAVRSEPPRLVVRFMHSNVA